jgi:predicted transcriptional regulator
MTQEVSENLQHAEVVQMTTQIVSAYVGHNSVGETQIPEVINSVYGSLAGINRHTETVAVTKQKPAVPIKKIQDDETPFAQFIWPQSR